MEVTDFFASFGVKVDPKELNKIDKQLAAIDKKIMAWNAKHRQRPPFQLSRFNVNRGNLRKDVVAALASVSKTTYFEIYNFRIRQAALRRSLGDALDLASTQLAFQVRNFVGPNGEIVPIGSAARAGARERAAGVAGRASGGAGRGRMGLGVGYMGLSPYALMGGGVGYGAWRGLRNLNRLNQEIVSAQLTTTAVANIAGYDDLAGAESLNWLKRQGQRVGFSWLDSTEQYNTFMSNAFGAGLDMEGGQDIYLGFSEYSRAMGVSSARQKLIMTALSQMTGKGVLSMEELRRQMAESMPGTFSVFQEAYAELTGSGLTGQDAFRDLVENVSAGNVESIPILQIVSRIMRERAAHKLEAASQTAQAEQARFENFLAAVAQVASPQTESATKRFFGVFTRGLNESGELAKPLAEYIEALGGGLDFASRVFQTQANLSAKVVEGWGGTFDVIGMDKGFGFSLLGAGILSRFSWFRKGLLWVGVTAVLEDIVEGLTGGDSLFIDLGEWLRGKIGEWLDRTTFALVDASPIGTYRRWRERKKDEEFWGGREGGAVFAKEQRRKELVDSSSKPLWDGTVIDLFARGLGGANPPTSFVERYSTPPSYTGQPPLKQGTLSLEGHINADISITGETTEEAVQKFEGAVAEALNDALGSAKAQFPLVDQ